MQSIESQKVTAMSAIIEFDMNNLSDIEINELNDLANFEKLDFLSRDFRNKLQSVQNLSEFDEIMENINRFNMYLHRIISNSEFKTSASYPELDEQYIAKLKKLRVLSLEMWENSKFARVVWGRKEQEKKDPKEIKPPKQPLTFTGLFKPPYVFRIDKFYNRLIAEGYIDKDHHIWNPTGKENEPAKVYFWLVDNGVFKINKPTPALICFCKEFGIIAYNTGPRPTAEIRAVTVRNLLNTKLTTKEKTHFSNVFFSFLIK